MNQQTLFSMCEITEMLDPIVVTADATCTGVLDMLGCCEALIIAHIGLTAATLDGSNYLEVQLEHSNTTTDGDYVAVPNADLSNYVTGSAVGTLCVIDAAADDNQAYMTSYNGSKRYVRAKVNETGTVVGLPVSIIGIQKVLLEPANSPT